jgi:transcriptional regulator with XRE-family HTH domain
MNTNEANAHHELILKAIGRKLKQLRLAKNLSYTAFAEQLGISRNGYNNIELAKANFQIRTLLLILDYHDVTLANFFKDIAMNH